MYGREEVFFPTVAHEAPTVCGGWAMGYDALLSMQYIQYNGSDNITVVSTDGLFTSPLHLLSSW